jgi:ABC-type methionine transport system ATPase subunit
MQNNMNSQQSWTTKQRVNLSRNLAIAFNPGMADSNTTHDDNWTTEKLINLSNSMAQAYLPR